MRPPSARIKINRVTVQHVTSWTKDAAGARQPVYGLPTAPFDVGVHPASAKDVPDHLRENGIEYVTVHFFEYPKTKIRSRINWLNVDPPAVLTAIGPVRLAAGSFGTWQVDCEIRPV